MATQKEIGKHLDLSQPEVSKLVDELGIDWRNEELSVIRVAYIRRLRAAAAGHRTDDGQDLIRERVLTEQVDRELKQFALAEKKGQLVSLAQLEPELSRMVGAWKTEVQGLPDKIKTELDALYGINVDLLLLEEQVNATFSQLARYDPERAGTAASAGGTDGAAAEDADDRVGKGAAPHVE